MKFKSFVLALLTFAMVTFLHAPVAHAVGSGAVPVQNVNGVNPIQNWGYSTLIASTVKGINGVQVNNTSPRAVELAFGAVGQEVAQIIVGGNQDTAFLPVTGGYATRLSVISLVGPSETGELDVNVFYN